MLRLYTGREAIWRLHRGKLVGAVAGLLIALLIRWLGLFWALLILVFMVLGALVGAVLVDTRADTDIIDE